MATTQDKPTLRPDDPRHGTWAGYGRGCRDECCRKAARQYQKLRIHDANHGKARLVDSRGAKRRLEALGALGWDFYSIATEMGLNREWVWQMYRHATIQTKTAQKIEGIYERLCMTRPEGWVADRARRLAAAKGWAPPLAWDDIDNDDAPDFGAEIVDVDEIKVERVLAGHREDCNLPERLAVIDRWEGSLVELARLTGWNVHRTINTKAA